MFWGDQKGLARGKTPLLAMGGSGSWPSRDHPSSELTLHLTPKGEEILKGADDWITMNGIDRWLGGVHLSGAKALWRWEGRGNRLVREK